MTDNTQPQTWHETYFRNGGGTTATVCSCNDDRHDVTDWVASITSPLLPHPVLAIIADHAAAAKLAKRDAEIESLRNERTSLIAEMNQHAVDARNDRQRLYEKVWAEEAKLAKRGAEADALAQALVRAESVLSLIRYRGPNPPVPPFPNLERPELSRDELDEYLSAIRAALTAHAERVKARDGTIPLDERRHV